MRPRIAQPYFVFPAVKSYYIWQMCRKKSSASFSLTADIIYGQTVGVIQFAWNIDSQMTMSPTSSEK